MQLMSLCALSSVLTVLLMVLLAPLSAHANRDHVKTFVPDNVLVYVLVITDGALG